LVEALQVFGGEFTEHMVGEVLGGVPLGTDTETGSEERFAKMLDTTGDAVVTSRGTTLGKSHLAGLESNVVV
jgi:hypothetical protein